MTPKAFHFFSAFRVRFFGKGSIRLCTQKPNYKVGVFTKTLQDAKEACSEAIRLIAEDKEESELVSRKAVGTFNNCISFTNGSIIKFVRASDNARGHKFHHILYDRNIDHELLATIVRPAEIRYREQHGC